MIKLSPSILSANFAFLASDIELLETQGADYVHIDVFDGHFAPNLSMGPDIVKAIRPFTKLEFDVHLMLEKPSMFIERFAKAGADIISVHQESSENLDMLIDLINMNNARPSLVINPETDVSKLFPYLEKVSMVLIMSVNPGFSGQKFMPNSLEKIKTLVKYKKEHNLDFDIEIDGGIKLENLDMVLEAGANVIVAGSEFFSAKDRAKRGKEFREIFRKYEK